MGWQIMGAKFAWPTAMAGAGGCIDHGDLEFLLSRFLRPCPNPCLCMLNDTIKLTLQRRIAPVGCRCCSCTHGLQVQGLCTSELRHVEEHFPNNALLLIRKIRAPIKIKFGTPPPQKRGILRTWFFLQKERIFPGVHKIGAPISGPRIADTNFTDTRIFLNLAIIRM